MPYGAPLLAVRANRGPAHFLCLFTFIFCLHTYITCAQACPFPPPQIKTEPPIKNATREKRGLPTYVHASTLLGKGRRTARRSDALCVAGELAEEKRDTHAQPTRTERKGRRKKKERLHPSRGGQVRRALGQEKRKKFNGLPGKSYWIRSRLLGPSRRSHRMSQICSRRTLKGHKRKSWRVNVSSQKKCLRPVVWSA